MRKDMPPSLTQRRALISATSAAFCAGGIKSSNGVSGVIAAPGNLLSKNWISSTNMFSKNIVHPDQ
jgi:hypothetical protein